MESIMNSMRSLFSTYGFRAAVTVIATVAIVNLIKIPLMRYAKDREEKTGVDKSVVSKFVTALPVAVALVLEIFTTLVLVKFNIRAVDFAAVFSNAVLYGALAVATYESVKKQLEAYAAKRNAENKIQQDVPLHFDKNADKSDAKKQENPTIKFSTN